MKVSRLKKYLSFFGMSLLLSVSLFNFVSCKNDDDEEKETPNVEYKITFEDFSESDEFGVAPDKTEVLKVKSSAGTWLIKEDSVPTDYITVTKNAKGNFEIHGVKETSENVSFTIYAKEDPSKTVTIKVYVYDEYFTLTLALDEVLAAKASSLKMTYGQDCHEAEITYTANAATGTAKLLKEKANSYGYFDKFVVTVIASDGTEIATTLSPKDYVCFYATNSDYFTELSLTQKVESTEKGTLTLNFTGFTILGGSVKVKYGADSGTYVDAEGTVSEDGTNATVELEKKYANADAWFNNITITVKDKEGTEVAAKYTNYFEFNADGMSLELKVESSEPGTTEWKTIVDAQSVTFDGNLNAVVSSEVLKALSGVSELKVSVANYASTSTNPWWATIDCGTAWSENKIELTTCWDDEIKGYSTTLSDETLAAYIENGIYLAGGSGDTATVTVSYLTSGE